MLKTKEAEREGVEVVAEKFVCEELSHIRQGRYALGYSEDGKKRRIEMNYRHAANMVNFFRGRTEPQDVAAFVFYTWALSLFPPANATMPVLVAFAGRTGTPAPTDGTTGKHTPFEALDAKGFWEQVMHAPLPLSA